jgi:hypothetical protein
MNNLTTDLEFSVTSAVRRWIDKKSRKFRILLENGEIKIKGSSKTLVPTGSFEEVYLMVYSQDPDLNPRTKRSPARRKNQVFAEIKF